MDKMKKPTAIAALTWLKDRWVSMKVPQSRAMVEKAIDEIGYRIPKKPDSKYDRSRHQYIPICQTCNTELDEEKSSENNFCPNCGQAIDWGNEHED
jgi:predicted RNA-binding Zn-ribbon protein involved in translation (DUF1610 family)